MLPEIADVPINDVGFVQVNLTSAPAFTNGLVVSTETVTPSVEVQPFESKVTVNV